MTKLEAVNLILRALGESPLPSLSVQYPTLSIVLPELDVATDQVLTAGYWFNTLNDVAIVADVNGDINVPLNVLSFEPEDPRYVYTGSDVRYADSGELVKDETIRGRIITRLEFERLPITAQYCVAYRAAVDSYMSDHGSDSIAERLNTNYIEHLMALGEQHIRARKASTRNSKRWQRYIRKLRA